MVVHIDKRETKQETINANKIEQETINISKNEKEIINRGEKKEKPTAIFKTKKITKYGSYTIKKIEREMKSSHCVVWNGVPHLQLWHKENKERLIHFPWANNSCALDSTLTALWIIYLRLQLKVERLALFESEYPKMAEVYAKLYHGQIHNVEAKNQFIKIFKDLGIRDERYREKKYVELNAITNYLKDRLHVLLPDTEESTFQWRFKNHWECKTYKTETCDHFIHHRESVVFMARSSKFSVQELLNTYVEDSVRTTVCVNCEQKNSVRRETITHPTILHLLYPTEDRNGVVDIPVFLEKESNLDDVYYDSVESAYGDGGHFIFRFLKDDKVYEADGMVMSTQLINRKKVRAALSKELPGSHEESLAGHINFKLSIENVLIIKGQKIVHVYYLKR